MPEKLSLTKLLRKMAALDGSDLHISAGAKPRIRQHGRIIELDEIPILTPDNCKELILSSLTDTQKKNLEENRELDLSFGLKGVSRFRGNIYFQRGSISGAFRKIPFQN